MLAAKLTERIANTVIRPPKKPLTEHMLVIVSTWRATDESVVQGAVEKGRKHAEEGSSNSTISKMFFGLLRFMGFGHIEATGEGGVEVQKKDDEDDLWVITTMIGVRVESSEKVAASLLTLHERARKMPSGILAALVGVKPGHASLVDLQADMT